MCRVESVSQCGTCPWVYALISIEIRGKQSSGIAVTLDIAERP